jgi:NAD(P)-dependent dehydrogenase (short-subunit alcohol dehydrogenase family)
MDLGLSGRVALVTGAYRGTGAGIARVLAVEGATVLVHGFEAGQAAPVVAEITAAGGAAHEVHGDLRTDTGADRITTQCIDAAGQVDILVNNYGLAEGGDWFEHDSASWFDVYDKNVVTGVRLVHRLVPSMRARGWGRVVFISTVGATRPGTRHPQYYTAKAALPGLTVSLAKELSGTGVTVNTISPGVIATAEIREMFTRRAEQQGRPTDWPSVERFILESAMANPSGRVANPEDIGRFVAFVVGEPGVHLNGAHLRIDGGAADAVS